MRQSNGQAIIAQKFNRPTQRVAEQGARNHASQTSVGNASFGCDSFGRDSFRVGDDIHVVSLAAFRVRRSRRFLGPGHGRHRRDGNERHLR